MHNLKKSEAFHVMTVGIIFLLFTNSLILKPVLATSSTKSCSSPNPETGTCDQDKTSSNLENKYSKDAEKIAEHDENKKNENQNLEQKIKELEKYIDGKINGITHSLIALEAEVSRVIDFNASVEIMHEAQEQNHKDLKDVSEWLYVFKSETGDKVQYIYSLLQNLSDYKMISEYEMEKMKPNIDKISKLEENLKTINNTLVDTNNVVFELDGNVKLLLEKHSKDVEEDSKHTDTKRRISATEEITQHMQRKLPVMEDKLTKLDDMFTTMEKDVTNVKGQLKNLEDRDQKSVKITDEINEMNSRITAAEKQIQQLKDASSPKVLESMVERKDDETILRNLKNDIEEEFKKLEGRLRSLSKEIQNNKYTLEKTKQKMSDMEKEVKSARNKEESMNKELLDTKKTLTEIKDVLRAKLIEDIALQSDHFTSMIKDEVGKLDRKITLSEKKVTKKLEGFDNSLLKVNKVSSENKESLHEFTSNYESREKELFKMVTDIQENLQNTIKDVTGALKDVTDAQETLQRMERMKTPIDENRMRNETIIVMFICMGVFNLALMVLILKKNDGITGHKNVKQEKGSLQRSSEACHQNKSTVSVLSFNAKGKKQHKKLTESVLCDLYDDISIVPCLISKQKDVDKISSKVVLVFVDSIEKIEGPDDLKLKTIQILEKLRGEVFVIFVGDAWSQSIGENELANPKLPIFKKQDLSVVVSKKRVLSIFKDFTQFQREYLSESIANLI